MPARTPKACRARGCYRPTTELHGFCTEHAGMAIGWVRVNEQRGSAEVRGYGGAWRRLRRLALQRDHYLCRLCADEGRAVHATEVDHIVNKASGGTDELSNLQSLCRDCHRAKTAAESAAARR